MARGTCLRPTLPLAAWLSAMCPAKKAGWVSFYCILANIPVHWTGIEILIFRHNCMKPVSKMKTYIYNRHAIAKPCINIYQDDITLPVYLPSCLHWSVAKTSFTSFILSSITATSLVHFSLLSSRFLCFLAPFSILPGIWRKHQIKIYILEPHAL